VNLKIYAFAPEAVFLFLNEEAESFSFDPDSPEDVGLDEGSLVEDAELSGSDDGKWCTLYKSVPKDMPEKLVIPNHLVK
jgi:hypothetical protein